MFGRIRPATKREKELGFGDFYDFADVGAGLASEDSFEVKTSTVDKSEVGRGVLGPVPHQHF